jgi:hypothetical protein
MMHTSNAHLLIDYVHLILMYLIYKWKISESWKEHENRKNE